MNYINKIVTPIGEHLRVPLGLIVENTRDFNVLEHNFDDEVDKNISVAPDQTMDYFYNSMVVSKRGKKISLKITKKKKETSSKKK